MSDWTETHDHLLVEGGYRGVTATPAEITGLIENQGWSVKSVKWKKDSFLAEVTSAHGEKLDAKGHTQADALAAALLRVYKTNAARAHRARTAAMDQAWLKLIPMVGDVAQAYAKAPFYDMKAGLAWHELAVDSQRRADEIHRQLTVEIVDDPQPYQDAPKMYEDIRKKRHLFVSRSNSQHPLWALQDVINFRIVHQVMGYAAADAPFGWAGEVQASSAHSQLLSANAKRALLSDRVGQMAFATFYGQFSPKIAFLSEIEKIIGLDQDTSTGSHPSQTIVPVQIPRLFSRVAGTYVTDPNQGWETGVQPLPNNARQWGGDPLDAYDEGGMMDTAGKIYTGWDNARNPDGTDNWDTMKQAVGNALRVVLLSPRKDLKWNAIHYQHLKDVPASVSDPKVYWDALEQQRENWNQARGYAPGSHKSYWKEQQQFIGYIRSLHPEMSPQQADEVAAREFQNVWNDLEEEIAGEIESDENARGVPEEKRKTQDEIERKVGREMSKRIKLIMSPVKDEEGYGDGQGQEQMSMFGAAPASEDLFGNEAGKYGAWMGAHMKALAQVGQHIDELTTAALQDARSGGEGYHFRQTLLGLGIPGVGPKVASFAWLLLKPTTSQLGTIDTHMLALLGYNEQDLNPRDYYRMERELAARRDAAGYGDVPLGAFQWGMWDARRTGIGSHQDHSGMKVLNPLPYDTVDWNHKGDLADEHALKNDPRWQWWRDTEPAAQQVQEDWRKTVAPYFPLNAIPGQAQQEQPQEGQEQPLQPTAKTLEDKDEFCLLLPLEPADALRIYTEVCKHEWPEGTELESPDEYHITLLYSHDGFNDPANHIWAKMRSQGGFKVECGELDLFGPDKDVAVIRLSSPELEQYEDAVRDEAKNVRGLAISEFEDGYKPHLTVAKGVSNLPVNHLSTITFRTKSALVSLPRTKLRFSSGPAPLRTPWHIDDAGSMVDGNPGESLMSHLRGTYGLTPEQVWEANFDQVGKQ
jgi:2'-5' RNA ligase